MAYMGAYNFGFSKPIIAKYVYDESTGEVSYLNQFQCGEGVSTTVTPNYANAKLYGDNKCVEEVNEFTNATISLGVTKMPLVAANMLFGHTITNTDAASGSDADYTEKSNVNDTANFVGYGFTAKNTDGTYDACVLYKVKFSEGEDAYNTKGDSISFKQPTLSGSALASDADNNWRIKKYGFTSETAAETWVKGILA